MTSAGGQGHRDQSVLRSCATISDMVLVDEVLCHASRQTWVQELFCLPVAGGLPSPRSSCQPGSARYRLAALTDAVSPRSSQNVGDSFISGDPSGAAAAAAAEPSSAETCSVASLTELLAFAVELNQTSPRLSAAPTDESFSERPTRETHVQGRMVGHRGNATSGAPRREELPQWFARGSDHSVAVPHQGFQAACDTNSLKELLADADEVSVSASPRGVGSGIVPCSGLLSPMTRSDEGSACDTPGEHRAALRTLLSATRALQDGVVSDCALLPSKLALAERAAERSRLECFELRSELAELNAIAAALRLSETCVDDNSQTRLKMGQAVELHLRDGPSWQI